YSHRKSLLELVVEGTVADVRQEGGFGPQLERHLDSLLDIEVRGMRATEPQRIQHQHPDAPQFVTGPRGTPLRVGDVPEVPYAEAEHLDFAVRYRQGEHVESGELHRRIGVKDVELSLGTARSGGWRAQLVEDVIEFRADHVERLLARVHREPSLSLHGEHSQVIDAVSMIGVVVREPDRIDTGDV